MRTTSLLFALVVVVAGCKKTQTTAAPATQPATASVTTAALTQEQVVAEIEKLGGKVIRSDNSPDGVAVAVLFDKGSEAMTDAVLEHLKGLNQLQGLCVAGTKVTDAGLVHLKGLDRLQMLYLTDTKVTDAGLEHLKGLHDLVGLDVASTKVTDAGLEHLKGLTQLQKLNLGGTKVTDEGVKKLQEALPNCDITR